MTALAGKYRIAEAGSVPRHLAVVSIRVSPFEVAMMEKSRQTPYW